MAEEHEKIDNQIQKKKILYWMVVHRTEKKSRIMFLFTIKFEKTNRLILLLNRSSNTIN